MSGYILVDCTGIELTAAEAKTISGMHARAAAAVKTGKPCFACNCTYNGYPVSPIPVQVIQLDDSNETIIASAEWIQVFITKANSVTVQNMLAD